MTPYSDAAKKYAGSSVHGDSYSLWATIARAFDASAALLAPASPPVPAPVLLTADDPRWRDGAKVRGEFEDGSAVEGIVEGGSLAAGSQSTCGIYRNRGHFAAVYLIAESPDPDADVRQALVEIMTGIGVHDLTTDEADQVIICLRERGVTL